MRTIIIYIALSLVSFVLGGYVAKRYFPTTVTEVKEKIVTVEIEKIVDRIIYKTKTVTKPDGTTIVVQTEDKIVTKVEVKEKIVEKITNQPNAPQPNWIAGVGIAPLTRKPTNIDLGYRVMGPIWTNANFNWQHHDLTLGLRIEF